MKEIALNIGFADSTYESCKTEKNDLIIYLRSWDYKIIKIVFFNAIQFIYRSESIVAGLYERTTETPFFLEALNSYYEQILDDHPFKSFAIMDIEDFPFFEIVAEKVIVSKEQ